MSCRNLSKFDTYYDIPRQERYGTAANLGKKLEGQLSCGLLVKHSVDGQHEDQSTFKD